ncbi:23S rRNA (adenine(2503)-C(2))-methyltransferase RlmN [Brevibacterium sp. GP-SGM9]|uniref:23S rRNA (adenine(2503)-C(2))-methyltransferase RlmN n=1 Tax=unclassified Brevibacterium TaxID=2614124 RepID=UPI001E48A68E|nr:MULTISPECIES: 23S rRNA (adenine(2503)-C(2))-methyltransferase RlmN [unclassified Brevibacterium]MCD1285920.1 dual-specificity RNA methyltransferase RlmN [Brevibacterium sp. CCUG 69071]MDK8434985.1 23S rRNA (adenine(2503)-C(2))-methyltransferase RlmN [Brevibacterium sp. H-BE7]
MEHPDGTTSTTPTRDGRPLLNFKSPRVSQPQQHLADMSMDERIDAVKEMGLPAFRAKQISTHYFTHFQTDAESMTDLPKDLRAQVQERFFPHLLTEVRRLRTENGDTIKFLWRLFDGALVESVLMRYRNRVTLCVSSQCGCGMNCPFCATGQQGLTRNMSTAEIVEQVVRANQVIAAGELAAAPSSDMPGAGETALGAEADEEQGEEPSWGEDGASASAGASTGSGPATSATGPERVSNIVFMGMGEPLANYKRVMNAVRRFVEPAPGGLGMSARRITVSTVGLVPGINKLAAEDIPVTFALSLHAPDDELRDEMIPVNTRWKADEAIDAAFNYYQVTGRRVSIEYALIKDMNDHAWRAELLAKKLNARGRGWVHVNPIPLNPTPGSVWTASEPEVANEFVRRLIDQGIPTTIRDTRGSDIDGACGQLAAAD